MLASHLKQGCPSLTTLDLGSCGMTSVGMEELASCLGSLTNLTTLSITGNRNVGADGWKKLFQALHENCEILETLELHSNSLGDGEVSDLADALKGKRLQKLDLEYNCISEIGGGMLLDLVERSTHLRELSISSGNDVSQQTLDSIKTVLVNRK